MNVSGLLPIIQNLRPYSDLVGDLRQGEGETHAAVLEAAKPGLLASLHGDLRRPVIVVVAHAEAARRLREELASWCACPVELFPEPDALPYERISSDAGTVRQRLKVLTLLDQSSAGGKPPSASLRAGPFIVASAHAVAQKTISPGDFAAAGHVLRQGEQISPDRLFRRWVALGYRVEQTVELPGAVSRRGGILDIYPPHADLPARIEFFGDQIESLRLFDPETQRSMKLVDSVTVVAPRELVVPADATSARVFEQLHLPEGVNELTERVERDVLMLLESQPFDGFELYSALFNNTSILEHLPPEALLVLDEPKEVSSALEALGLEAQELRGGAIERGELPPGFPSPCFSWPELAPRLERCRSRLALSRWGLEEPGQRFYQLPFSPAPAFWGKLPQTVGAAKAAMREGRRLIIVSQQASRLAELFEEGGITVSPRGDLLELPPAGSVSLVHGSLDEGWSLKWATLLTDKELFGLTKQRRPPKGRRRHYEDLLDLRTGDLVVHVDHGIARFGGMVTVATDGVLREYLFLEYAAGDKLYVPSEQIDRVSRYIASSTYAPALSRLGTQEWSRIRRRVRESVDRLAEELLAIYAVREASPGIASPPDTPWQQELEASFPYEETPDQLQAVADVKEDMERARPMDRLVCGDVGYGKTEVALRAAFKAVMNGMQVAVLVPTTVLAEQHLATFGQRLAAFPVTVEVLSRFRSEKEQQRVVEGLKDGSVDICIGTHRLLQKDVLFKNLGLVVIDEEQRFGVGHKERLKRLRSEVDVLTLSATPIPRTLYMSLSGLRDMSTMETPPEERLPVKTYVADYDDRTVREAILRELERDGQVFFVHNRVQSIRYVAEQLRSLAPEARIAVAHGQMPEEQLEKVMLDFSQGRVDVLVCTVIIESGLDMPNVNTIIINHADQFGLAQLYQLRGRVGRGTNRAYAYLFHARGKRLTDTARQRLRTLFETQELGAGFRIALKDLEIRGAGNLLGAEQSGQIGSVGFTLYCQMLAEAVERLRSQQRGAQPRPPAKAPSATVDLPLPAHIPESYVAETGTRLALYQRLSRIDSVEGVEEIAQELRDRFGEAPESVKDLLYVVKLKALAARARLRSVAQEDGVLVLKALEGTQVHHLAVPKDLPRDAVRIGHTQVRLERRRLGPRWREGLEQLVAAMAV
ncbi:MAG: transcription-repair coupling factor [Chloroflexi bacterium]|nr:transcription-repair coupling factor [Chloroflexota bacterium]